MRARLLILCALAACHGGRARDARKAREQALEASRANFMAALRKQAEVEWTEKWLHPTRESPPLDQHLHPHVEVGGGTSEDDAVLFSGTDPSGKSWLVVVGPLTITGQLTHHDVMAMFEAASSGLHQWCGADAGSIMTIELVVGPDGGVRSANVTETESDTAGCVAAVLQTLRFARSENGGGVRGLLQLTSE